MEPNYLTTFVFNLSDVQEPECSRLRQRRVLDEGEQGRRVPCDGEAVHRVREHQRELQPRDQDRELPDREVPQQDRDLEGSRRGPQAGDRSSF